MSGRGPLWSRDGRRVAAEAATAESLQGAGLRDVVLWPPSRRNGRIPPLMSRMASVGLGGPVKCSAWNLSLIHISEPTRLGMISYAVFCLKKKKKNKNNYKRA